MGKPGAYLTTKRHEHDMRPAAERIDDYRVLTIDLPLHEQREQASRCMNCGVGFCMSGLAFNGTHRTSGCPLHNLIPETNDLMYRGRMEDAAARLSLTNPFPEFTGRVCPAPCEVACNLGLNDAPVTIHDNERALSDWMWKQGMAPLAPAGEDAALVSVIGSGPAGLAAAWELTRRGVRVRVYERDDKPGGLLVYGIPNMKLPKDIVMRRIALMEQSGIEFMCGTDAVECAEEICSESDAIVVAIGARVARTLGCEGEELAGVYPAVDYLTEVTKAGLEGRDAAIDANGLDVVVIGGGDTGVDCIACALRQGAKSVRQVIRAQCPPPAEQAPGSWPAPRGAFSQGYGQQEAQSLFGQDPRLWGHDTLGFSGDGDHVSGVRVRSKAAATCGNGESGEQTLPAQLVLIAKGFTGPEQQVIDVFETHANNTPVVLAGDAKTGPSLVVNAIASGLDAATQIAEALGL